MGEAVGSELDAAGLRRRAVAVWELRAPSPLAAAMETEQGALAGELLVARKVVPMHYGGFEIDPWYRPIADAVERFRAAAAGRAYEANVLRPGESVELTA